MIHSYKNGNTNVDPEAAVLIDWGVQMADVWPGWVTGPSIDSLDWEHIAVEYQHLRGTSPYSLLVAAIQLPSSAVGLSAPVELWPGLWIWPAPSSFPPADPWKLSEHPFPRSPYQTLVNMARAFPDAIERLQTSAGGPAAFLTSMHPWVYDGEGHRLPDDRVWSSALADISLAQTAIMLATGSCISIPYVLWVSEPFFGHTPIAALSTPGLVASVRDVPISLDKYALREIRRYAGALKVIRWLSVPYVPFLFTHNISGTEVVSPLMEQYVSSTYLEYALLLWNLTCARSSLETILNAWSAADVLFTGETKQIKGRLRGAAGTSDTATLEAIEKLAELRNAFGHGRHDTRHQRVLLGNELPAIRNLMTKVFRRVVLEVASDPHKYENRDELIKWAESQAGVLGDT